MMPPGSRGDPLQGLHVLAIGADVATRFASWWLAECGADVAAFRPGRRAAAASGAEAIFEQQVGRGIRAADFAQDAAYEVIVGDATSIGELRPAVPEHLAGGASTVEVTSPLPMGTGFAEGLLHDMALWARSGLGYLTREVTEQWRMGDPCLPLNRQASLLAGMAAAIAVASEALARATGEAEPRRIACDTLELLSLMPMQPIAFAQMSDRIVGRASETAYPGGMMASADGAVLVRPVEPAHWARLFRVVGELDWAADTVEETPSLLLEAQEPLDARLRAWARAGTSERLVAEAQAEHVPAAAVRRPEEVVRDPHLADRGFFRSDGAFRGLQLPWLANVERPAAAARDEPERHSLRPRGGLPLAGLRILDLTWAWAGPFATTMLADLGAEVINIEWHPRASNLRKNPPYVHDQDESDDAAGWWSANQRGKLSVGVNLREPDGKQIVKDLAARSDVVVENFSPGVVGRLGIGYDDLVTANPRLVYVSLSAYGQTGPNAHYVGYGNHLYAASGAGYATSLDGETFSQMWIPYPDPVSGLAGAFAIAAYARKARVAGRPAFIDVSEMESLCCVMMEPLLAVAQGDSRAAASWDGAADYLVVRTADEHFVALLAREQADWAASGQALEASDASPAALRAAAARLDVATLLVRVEQAGLIAAEIRDSADCLDDPLLNERGFWVNDESPAMKGSGVRIGGSIWQVDGRRAAIWRGAPRLFSDTRTVLERVLEYGPAQVDDLFAAGVVE